MSNLDLTIENATDFVLASRNSDSMWYNFLTRYHGESADWVSSFVALNLLESDVDKDVLSSTVDSILERQRENGGFSYNHKIVPDADSTAFAILLLSQFDYEQEVSKAKEFLSSHQQPDGSFSTYSEDAIRNYFRITSDMSVEGWCSGTSDITLSALRVFPNNKSAIDYLVKNQDVQGFWRSYWWSSDVYSTAYGAMTLNNIGLESEAENARQWLADSENIPNQPFYLALSIQALSLDDSSSEIVNERVDILLASQMADGSWATQPKLQFPIPGNKEPWNNPERWREDTRDQNRIFTTSTCLKALSDYRKKN